MSRKQRGPAPGEWKYTVGEVPHLLTAHERADKGNAIYTRVWDGRRYTQRKMLCGPIRDASGKIIPEREIEAQQLAIHRQGELASGAEVEEERGGPLTLAAGFRRLLHVREGKYPGSTPHRQDVERYARIIRDALGADLRWDAIKHKHYRALWRHLAHAHVKDSKFGVAAAEKIVGVLQSAARWLQQEGLIEPGEALPAPGWKQAMRAEWAEITQAPIARPEKPRYTDAEARKLWAALPKADPRVALAMQLGAELRLGQVARVRRSDVLPSPDGRFRIGMIMVHGRGKKHGGPVVLTMRERHALTRAMTSGYLALAEAAYRRGEIADYQIIAGGRLHTAKDRRGREVKRVRVEGAAKYIGKRALARRWREFEDAAKVDHVEGRLWYGLRRRGADDVDALKDVDPRVKNRVGHWTKSTTREGYLEEATMQDAVAAAEVRKRIRPKGGSGT